jgi:hypothetical protein
MPLETGDFIGDLDRNYPLGGDPISQGDNHITLIKKVLQQTFPGAAGNGFKKAIIATEDELNFLDGINSNIANTLSTLQGDVASLRTRLSAPTGTRMVFHQVSAPTGWAQVTTFSNHMLRVVSTAGGGSGGTDSPILNSKVPSHTHTFSGTTGTDYPDHTHQYGASMQNIRRNGNDDRDAAGLWATYTTGGANQRHQHDFSGTTAGNVSASNWTPQYVDMILAQKSA